MPKTNENIFEILQHMAKNERKYFEILQRNMAKKRKKIFLKFYNPLFSSEAEIWPKTKKIFLKFNNIALCGIQNRCIWAYSELFIFIRSRDMAKKRKNILKFNNIALSRDMAKKRKKLFLKFYNVALCIWAYSSFYFHQKPRYGQKRKKYFEILQHSIHCAAFKIDAFGPIRSFLFSSEAEIWPKTKKNILKFYNIWPKNEKNIFEILQRSIVRQLKKMHTGLFRAFYFHKQPRYGQKQKNILKFNNIALCGIQNRCIWAYSSFYFHQKPRYGQKRKKYF
ncbi:hypothetical protein PUN28_010899 [Cardiocondyla obscurior]|uniref:Ribosomal protein S11 n=1 Tax=Cardiocondyla obscurior TaxID=286306 RepID=A0AAW2FP12_9HYME